MGQHGLRGGLRSAVSHLPAPEGERIPQSCQGAGKTRFSGTKFVSFTTFNTVLFSAEATWFNSNTLICVISDHIDAFIAISLANMHPCILYNNLN